MQFCGSDSLPKTRKNRIPCMIHSLSDSTRDTKKSLLVHKTIANLEFGTYLNNKSCMALKNLKD